MKTILIENDAKHGFIRQVIMPGERRNNIPIPRAWFGKRVEVILYTAPEDAEKPLPNAMPFKVNRQYLESVRAPGSPGLLSENLIRADRDAR